MSEADDMIRDHRQRVPPQPATDTYDLARAVKEFEAALPGWWWSVGVCSLTRDASCGPDIAGPDAALLRLREFDEGFHCDDPQGTLASSLHSVMQMALAAKSALNEKNPPTEAGGS